MTVAGLTQSPWARLGVAIVAVCALYVPIFAMLVHEWATVPSLSHGFLVPVISAYLVWARRRELAQLTVSPSGTGLPVLIGGFALYLVGTLGNEPFVSRLAFLVSLTGAIVFIAGGMVMRALVPAVGYLALMIPLPYVTLRGLTDQLRLIEASTSASILPLLGVPVLQDGFLLHLPNMTLEVAEVCSSISAVMSLLALGAAFGYVAHRPRAVHMALIVVAVPLGFLSNIVRITLTATGVYYVGPIAVHNVLHSWHGTMVFIMTVGALSLIDTGLMRLRLEPR